MLGARAPVSGGRTDKNSLMSTDNGLMSTDNGLMSKDKWLLSMDKRVKYTDNWSVLAAGPRVRTHCMLA